MPAHSETILTAIQTALEAVSVSTGYGMDVASVQRYDRESLSTIAKPCILIFTGPERMSREGDGGGWTVQMDVALELHLHQSPGSSQSTDEFQLAAGWDLQRCLNQDVNWETLQAELVDVETAGFEIEDPEGAIEDGVMMSLTCTYKVAGEDMTTLIY